MLDCLGNARDEVFGSHGDRRRKQLYATLLNAKQHIQCIDKACSAIMMNVISSDRADHDFLQAFWNETHGAERNQHLISIRPPFGRRSQWRGFQADQMALAQTAAIDADDFMTKHHAFRERRGGAQLSGCRLLAVVDRHQNVGALPDGDRR